MGRLKGRDRWLAQVEPSGAGGSGGVAPGPLVRACRHVQPRGGLSPPQRIGNQTTHFFSSQRIGKVVEEVEPGAWVMHPRWKSSLMSKADHDKSRVCRGHRNSNSWKSTGCRCGSTASKTLGGSSQASGSTLRSNERPSLRYARDLAN
eukprot:627840-Rhodomonas_salina.2